MLKLNDFKNVIRLMTILLCGVLVFTACNNDIIDDALETNELESIITGAQAIEAALVYFPGGVVKSCELINNDDDDDESEIKLYNVAISLKEDNFGVFVNAISAAVEWITNEADIISRSVDFNNFIGDDEARSIALNLAGGGQITLCRLSYNNGEAEYEVGVINGDMTYFITIDAYTGEVVRFTRDSITQPNDPTEPSTPTTPTTPTTPATNVTIENAKSIALSRVGGGTIARVETKYHKHGVEFNVLIVKGDYRYCVHVNSSTGYVSNMHTDLITTVASNAYGYSAAVSSNQAKTIAIQCAGGGIVTECKLEYKKSSGALIYHVHVANGQYEYCVEINASSSAVIKIEPRYKP